MKKKPKYTVLLISEKKLDENIYFCELNNVFTFTLNNKTSIMYDLVLDTKALELYHGFNMELIKKLDDITKLWKEDKSLVTDEIKRLDFDISFAIDMLGGSSKVFENILINYLGEYQDVEDRILNLLEINDYSNIRKIIHKIKGVSSYLGSEKLLYLSEVLEYRLYNNLASKEDVCEFIKYHNRILEYVRAQV